MTWALVNETSGNSTFSRLDTVSCRPSTRTRWRSPTTARLPLDHDILRVQVVAQPAPRGVPQPAVGGPDGVGDLADQLRLYPVRVAGHLPRQRPGERRRPARGEQRLDVAQVLLGDPRADAAGVDQPPLVVVHAEQQRADTSGPPSLPRPPAADHHRLGAEVLDLDPLRAADAGPVGRLQPLGDNPFEAVLPARR